MIEICIITLLSKSKQFYILIRNSSVAIEAGRGAAARGVTAKPTDCGFDPHSRR